MHKGFRKFCITLAIILGIYFTWANAGRNPPSNNIKLIIDSTYTISTDHGNGNIVGICPYMIPEDYASKSHFFNKLDGYLQIGLQKGWFNKKTVVLFPEYTAKWLVIEGEKQSIYTAATTGNAMATFVSSNFFSYMRSWFTAPDGTADKIRYSIFSSKGKTVARIYVDVFSSLAKKYQVTIVAASVLLPSPEVERNRINVRKGPLYNTTAVFFPDGTVSQKLVLKEFPGEDEVDFTAGSGSGKASLFDLPIGKTSIMIGSDSWRPEFYQSANQQNTKIVLAPEQLSADHGVQITWNNSPHRNMFSDFDTADSGKLNYEEARIKYGLPGRIRKAGIPMGISVSLRGRFWDNGSDGEYIAVSQDTVYTGNYVSGGSMVCFWVNQPFTD